MSIFFSESVSLGFPRLWGFGKSLFPRRWFGLFLLFLDGSFGLRCTIFWDWAMLWFFSGRWVVNRFGVQDFPSSVLGEGDVGAIS